MSVRITSRQNPVIQRIARLAADAGFRKLEGEYVCDGAKLYEEALSSKAPVKTVVYAEGFSLAEPGEGVSVIETPRRILEAIAPTRSPQGVLFTCAFPAAAEIGPEGRYILLDRFQDPGNVGAVVRSAEAFGLDAVLWLEGTADPFGPKAARASMGAVFRQPMKLVTLEELSGMKVYAADMRGTSADGVEWGPCVVAVGQEGRGLSGELLERADARISVPMRGKAESLNAAVAASIILWEMMK